ncbi:MAG: penicillin-binding protein 1A, partial [bacterium]
ATRQAVERARDAADDAERRVTALDQQIRADNVSAPGALDAFADASRAADRSAAAAQRASQMTSAADAGIAAMEAADAASQVRAATDAAIAAIAVEVGGRKHDIAALTRVRTAAQQSAQNARIHAQQASRIARSVQQEAVDDNDAVAHARTRVAELSAQVAFAAERADFASSEAVQTTDLAIATGAQAAADDAAQEAEDALLALESADDALADIISSGATPMPVHRAPNRPMPATAPHTSTPPLAERIAAAPIAPPPVAPPPIAAPLPAPAPAPQPVANVPAPVVAPIEAEPVPAKKKGRLRRILGVMAMLSLIVSVLLIIGGGVGGYFGYHHYSTELPTVDALQTYRPPTVTTVYDHEGELLGEIYEERRYVTELDQMPEHLQQAFTSSEDKAFWEHNGVNWIGLVRAMSVLITTGEKSQGASTITMQVTRNFLLTRDKTYERKIKEIILARRIEDVYEKERILYLYLNELYLGSGAYGVEAAARTYFGKHVNELTLAESAMIAGLAPAPSTYSPHQNFDKAKVRQGYVLGRMLEDGHISQSDFDDAMAEEMVIVERSNEFLEKSPYFTEHVRRHIVNTYGHERVYNEGLSVTTTCDLDLQEVAQAAVRKGVDDVDQRMGFRRPGLENISQAQIPERVATLETEMIDAWVTLNDPSGQQPRPETSTLAQDELYTGVLTEVTRNYATVKIGSHEGIIPIAWSRWVFKPDHTRSWRSRSQNDLTQQITWDLPLPEDAPEDAEVQTETGAILQVGDVVLVKVKALSTQDEEVASDFRGTPGEDSSFVATHLWQRNEVDAALLSYDLDSGAVRAMVGGADFGDSEFNRATQAMRQVGSTFKPIVYAAAIESKRVTAATMVTDGPLAFATGADFIWKPGNYSNSYLGNMTLRKALAMSRNTCTIRVLDRVDPGMNDDIVYDFVRRLGIGGPPTHSLPEDWTPTPDSDHACPWIREEADFTICADRYPPMPPGLTDREHRAELTEESDYRCRACDLSMGLGSRSLTMEELMRAYSTFATGGTMIEPYYIEEVQDRDGNVLESHANSEPVQVLDPAVAYITTWLMEGVVQGGTAGRAARLGLHLAGKTGTTNDEKDMWFIGFNPEVITSVYVGYDQPRSLGVSSTGGRTALPIWMDYMKVAVPPERDYAFPVTGDIEWANIEESTGRRVTGGGRRFPFLRGTVPESTGISAGQVSIDDIQTEL